MGDIKKERSERKWISTLTKRKKKGSKPSKSGGPTVLNPKWEGQSGGRATHGYGRAYMKGGKV